MQPMWYRKVEKWQWRPRTSLLKLSLDYKLWFHGTRVIHFLLL